MVHFQSARSPRKGACHCGAVTFTAELASSTSAMRCNCSFCSMKGAAMLGVPAQGLQILTGDDALGCYRFHSNKAAHYFCKTCGIHTFHQRRADNSVYAVNAACLTGANVYADFPDIPVADGRNHPEDNNGQSRIAGTIHYRPHKAD